MNTEAGGFPLVVVPGIQGRWEWLVPAIDALAARHRVMTFSLRDVGGSDLFQRWTDHIDQLLDRAAEPAAVIVGTSFGGFVALAYAAARPERVTHLVLVSTPPPDWRPSVRETRMLAHPRLALPIVAWRALQRLSPEVMAACPTWPSRLRFGLAQLGRILRYPAAPTHMAACVRATANVNLLDACARVRAPTLVVTGERRLDRIVHASGSLRYLSLITGARHVVFAGTGHIGLLLRPHTFEAIVTDFVERGVPRPPAGTEEPSSSCI
jgi:3-oxoadipate enol-lactonase